MTPLDPDAPLPTWWPTAGQERDPERVDVPPIRPFSGGGRRAPVRPRVRGSREVPVRWARSGASGPELAAIWLEESDSA